MGVIGSTLTTFCFGSDATLPWQSFLWHMHHITLLYAHNVRSMSIPTTHFRGFEHTFTELFIGNGGLASFEEPICFSNNLRRLDLSHNFLGISGKLSTPCYSPFSDVRSLTVSYKEFRRFPVFPNLTYLYLEKKIFMNLNYLDSRS